MWVIIIFFKMTIDIKALIGATIVYAQVKNDME